MPRTKRRFEDNVSDDSDDDNNYGGGMSMTTTTTTAYPRTHFGGGGKQLSHMMGGRPGGGGKQIRTMAPSGMESDHEEDDDEDEDEDSEEEEQQAHSQSHSQSQMSSQQSYYNRGYGGGKQFRPTGGKSLRRYGQDDDEDDEESASGSDSGSANASANASAGGEEEEEEESQYESEEEEAQPVQYAPRGGGKSLMRQQQPAPEESDSDEEDEEEVEEDHQPEPEPPVQYAPRGGGKSLIRHQQPQQDESDDEEDEEEEDTQPVTYAPRGGGKSLMRHQQPSDDEEEEEEDTQPVSYAPRGGGKSLMRHQQPPEREEESEEEEEEEEPVSYAPRGGGKSLMRHQQPPQRGGKMLIRPNEQEEQHDDESSDESEEEDTKPRVITGNVRGFGGKVLHRVDDEKNDDDYIEEDDKMNIDSDSDEEMETVNKQPAKKPTQKPQTSPATTAGRSTRSTNKIIENVDDDDDDEEMDESSVMEESEESSEEDSSESEDEPELDVDKLDQNDLIEDEADRKYLDGLPEIERESILAQRFEKRKAELDMKRALRENKRKEREKKRLEGGKTKKASKGKKKKKSKATKTVAKSKKDVEEEKKDVPDTSKDHELAQELGLGRAAKTPSNVETKRQAAIEQFNKERAANQNEDSDELEFGDDSEDDSSDEEYADESKPWMKKKTGLRSALNYSSNEEDYGDDSRGKNQRSFVEADLDDFKKVTIPRRRLSRWCNEPFFEEAVMNFYVRLAIGRDKKSQKPCYRLCKIIGTATAKEYMFPAYHGKEPVKTDRWIQLKFADSSKHFKMNLVSDSRPDQNDVNQYLSGLKNIRGGSNQVLSKKEATSLKKKQEMLISNYVYTTEDIQKSIAKTKALKKKVGNIAAEKTRVNIAVLAAQTELEDAQRKADELKMKIALNPDDDVENGGTLNELSELKDSIIAFEEALKKRKEEQKKVLDAESSRIKQLKRNTKNQKWAEVNERAKKLNKQADIEAYKAELALKKSGQKEPANPFARRKVKPKVLWLTSSGQEKKEDEIEGTSNEAENNKNEAEGAMQVEDNVETPRSAADDSPKKKLSEQINEMSIDEESIPRLMMSNTKKVVTNRVRKGMSITEYFERKQAGTL